MTKKIENRKRKLLYNVHFNTFRKKNNSSNITFSLYLFVRLVNIVIVYLSHSLTLIQYFSVLFLIYVSGLFSAAGIHIVLCCFPVYCWMDGCVNIDSARFVMRSETYTAQIKYVSTEQYTHTCGS